jgi:hypothetical protein
MLDRVRSGEGTIAIVYVMCARLTKWLNFQHFSVRWKDTARNRVGTTSGRVILDGMRSGEKSIMPGRLGHHNTAERSYFSTGPKSIRHYMFSNLSLTGSCGVFCLAFVQMLSAHLLHPDDDAFLDENIPRDMGTIKIQIWAAIKTDRECLFSQPPEQRGVHERTKKVTTHCVKYNSFGSSILVFSDMLLLGLEMKFTVLRDGSSMCRALAKSL